MATPLRAAAEDTADAGPLAAVVEDAATTCDRDSSRLVGNVEEPLIGPAGARAIHDGSMPPMCARLSSGAGRTGTATVPPSETGAEAATGTGNCVFNRCGNRKTRERRGAS